MEQGPIPGAVHRVRMLPSGREVEARSGEMLYAAVRRAGLPVGASCGLEGICGRCGLRVVEGADALTPEGEAERSVKAANRVDPALRLSCVARIRGSLVVTADYW